MMHGWQREPTDGPKRWLELCFLEWLQRLQWPPHPQLLDVAWCSAAVVVVVADVVQYGPGEFMHFCTMHVIMGLGLGWGCNDVVM